MENSPTSTGGSGHTSITISARKQEATYSLGFALVTLADGRLARGRMDFVQNTNAASATT